MQENRDSVLSYLVCSHCKGALRQEAAQAICEACGKSFRSNGNGQLDLRLRHPEKVSVEFELGNAVTDDSFDFGVLSQKPDPEVDFSGANAPWHLTPELLSYFPRAADPSQVALDLGCGSGLHRAVCERAGFRWLGVDYGNPQALALADAHSLPLSNSSVDFVLSMAVLEHLQYPFVTAREVLRVLKPGGYYIGTVSFLEPFHGDSYYHHTHFGTFNTLRSAGFEILRIAPTLEWSGLRAQAEMALFPRAPAFAQRFAVWPVELLHKLWWKLGSLKGSRSSSQLTRVLRTTGSFQFVARKRAR